MSGRKVRKSAVQSVPGRKSNMKTTGSGKVQPGPKKRVEFKENLPRVSSVSSDDDDDEGGVEKEMQRTAKLEDYTNMVRDKCVLTDRWMVYDPQQDPSKNQRASLVMEMDKTVEGELRIKRCVKIFDDRTYQVLIDNVDMTSQFDYINNSKKLQTTHDSDKLIHALITKKVCQGLRTYDPKNPILIQGNLPIKQRGKLWYAKECTVIVTKAFMGNSCNACIKVRNQIRRCLQNDTRKKTRPAMKQVKSTFGKALYSLLNDFSGRGPIPPSQYPRENMVFDEKLGIHLNFELHQRLYIASTMPPPPMPLSKSRSRKNRRGSGRGRYPPPSSTITSDSYPIQQFITEDGQLCYVANVVDGHNMGSDLQYGMPMMVEKFEPSELNEYVQLPDGSFVIQNVNGQEFTLAEGQEYELLGEAPVNTSSIDPSELVPVDSQQIQIIEVDDATMEQIQVHNSMEDMQIASIDPNDPNLSQLFRVFQSHIQGLAL
ncbi:hypothetical protein Fcan01_12252 [Folsomia candida]|uniref:Uncharacterized protein n=2 Tax=Folsomia candida TaxID=158441 RepID=A0A226E6V1_FOLCA|nr:hypothetical protein Fcan01_12252 [Folsomia candida]